MTDKALQTATAYAKKSGLDLVRPAGERDGREFFNIMRSSDIGHKIGLPHIISIDESGTITRLQRLDEIMWAHKEMVRLSKSSSQ